MFKKYSPMKEPWKDPWKEPLKEPWKESWKEPLKEPSKEENKFKKVFSSKNIFSVSNNGQKKVRRFTSIIAKGKHQRNFSRLDQPKVILDQDEDIDTSNSIDEVHVPFEQDQRFKIIPSLQKSMNPNRLLQEKAKEANPSSQERRAIN